MDVDSTIGWLRGREERRAHDIADLIISLRSRLADAEANAAASLDLGVLSRRIRSLCEDRGWSLSWVERGVYLHLECSELIEAWRGKGGDPAAEVADVLFVLLSIIGIAQIDQSKVLGHLADLAYGNHVCNVGCLCDVHLASPTDPQP